MEAGRKKLLLTLARSLDAQTESIRKGTFVPDGGKVLLNWFGGMYAKKELGIPLNQPTPVDVIAPKKKYASIGKTQMTSGRRSTIQTSSTGLMSKATVGKKTLLGG